jgi:acyl carrier protein
MAKATSLVLPTHLTEASLTEWLKAFIAARAGLSSEQIDVEASFDAFGLDSRTAVQASGALEKALSLRLPPGLLYEYPTVSALAAYLAGELGCAEPKAAP